MAQFFKKKHPLIKRIEKAYEIELTEVSPEDIWRNKKAYFLDKNKRLKGLNLSFLSISNLNPLKTFVSLTELHLSSTKVWDLTPLQNLKRLRILDLSGTKVSDLTALKFLPKLERLYLNSTKISNLTQLQELKQLEVLSLSKTPVSNLKGLERLKMLKRINLNSTKISDLTQLQSLELLEILFANSTKISNLAPLKGLKKLQILDIRQCEINSIPLFITEWKHLDFFWEDTWGTGKISLFGNPLIPEVINQNKAFARTYLLSLKENPIFNKNDIVNSSISVEKNTNIGNIIQHIENKPKKFNSPLPLNEVKVVLIGNGGSGKTSLLKNLIGKTFDEQEDQTHGIRIYQWELVCQGDQIKVNFWDFGGQEVNHATHQFFYSKRAVYLLVLDARHEDKAEYWLKHIENLGGNSPVLIVLNKIDENPFFDVDRKFLWGKYGQRIKGFYRISCKSGKGIAAVKTDLQRHLYDLEFRRTPFAPAWFAVKEDLVALATDKNYISYGAYHDICAKYGVQDTQRQDVLLNFLDDLGIILHFEALRRYDKQVLSPLWLTQGVYRIINSPLIANEREGEVFFQDLEGILNDFERYNSEEERAYRYPTDTHLYLLDIMQQFELCYVLGRDHYIIPDLLPKQQANGLKFGLYPLHFVLEYEGLLPRSVLPRFMVRMHKDIVEGKQNRWRTGVVLENPLFRATAIVRADYAEKEIHIWVKGEERRKMLSFIRSSLKEIHNSFQKLPIVEWLIVEAKGQRTAKIEYERLLVHEEERQGYFIYEQRKMEEANVLLNGIELPEARQMQPLQAFLSYSKEDFELKKAFKKMLDALRHTHQLELWDEREIDAGKDWEAEILRHLQQAPLIFLLISPDFIANRRIWEVEIPKALERHHRGEAIVVPIILRPCMWKDLDFSKLQALPDKGNPITKWDNQDDAFLKVGEAIKQLLESKRMADLRARLQRKFGQEW